MNTICFPNYNHSILNTTASILNYYKAPVDYAVQPSLKPYFTKKPKNVILMIFDGMGVSTLKAHLPQNNFLSSHLIDEVTSVFPPTTTAATTSYYSGKSPLEHGWLGWACYFKEYEQVIELFTDKDFYTQKPSNKNVADSMAYETIYTQIEKATCGRIQTHEVFPASIRENGTNSIHEMIERVQKITQNGQSNFIVAYWSNPDHQMHETGPLSEEVTPIMQEINSEVEKLAKDLKDSLLIISADHGQITVKKEIFIEDYPDLFESLSAPLSMEPRALSLFIKPDKKEKFASLFNQYLGDKFMLLSRNDVFAKKIFGYGIANHHTLKFLGDFLALATDEYMLVQHGDAKSLVGAHAGLLKDEMTVPLIVVDKI